MCCIVVRTHVRHRPGQNKTKQNSRLLPRSTWRRRSGGRASSSKGPSPARIAIAAAPAVQPESGRAERLHRRLHAPWLPVLLHRHVADLEKGRCMVESTVSCPKVGSAWLGGRQEGFHTLTCWNGSWRTRNWGAGCGCQGWWANEAYPSTAETGSGSIVQRFQQLHPQQSVAT